VTFDTARFATLVGASATFAAPRVTPLAALLTFEKNDIARRSLAAIFASSMA
jgi:hypothetical protein